MPLPAWSWLQSLKSCSLRETRGGSFGFTLHLRTRGEEIAGKREAGKTARRWVVERAHSWLNRFRRILIRWDKKPGNYLAMLHFACAIITWRQTLPG